MAEQIVYQARPASGGPWPGVVVLHDALGLTEDTRRHADWLAEAGYLVAAPDLYAHGNRIACIAAAFRSLASRKGRAFDDIEAARAALAADPACTGQVGVIGFCMGGSFALLAAAGRGFGASSVNYGSVPADAEALLSGACPVIGSFGAKDKTLKGAAGRLERALAANGVPHAVKEYPGANHSFMDRHGGLGGWLMARMGLDYRPDDAADAQTRILAFFGEHLGGAAARP